MHQRAIAFDRGTHDAFGQVADVDRLNGLQLDSLVGIIRVNACVGEDRRTAGVTTIGALADSAPLWLVKIGNLDLDAPGHACREGIADLHGNRIEKFEMIGCDIQCGMGVFDEVAERCRHGSQIGLICGLCCVVGAVKKIRCDRHKSSFMPCCEAATDKIDDFRDPEPDRMCRDPGPALAGLSRKFVAGLRHTTPDMPRFASDLVKVTRCRAQQLRSRPIPCRCDRCCRALATTRDSRPLSA